MAEWAPYNLKVKGLSPASGSYKNVFSKLKSYCLLQHVTINSHGVWYDRYYNESYTTIVVTPSR